MFSLDVTPQEDPDDPDDPDNPDNPTRPHDQSGHTCGLLGLEFFVVLLEISILRFYWRK